MDAKLFAVDEAFVRAVEGKQSTYAIGAFGRAPTSGWKNAHLIPYIYIMPPSDGIWDFDLVATAPDGISLQVISPISADPLVIQVPAWFKGVRVHASSNETVSMVSAEKSIADLLDFSGSAPKALGVDGWPWRVTPLAGGSNPWPWSAGSKAKQKPEYDNPKTLSDPLGSLIGKFPRVYEEGSAVTMDYRPDRVNLVTSKESGQIVQVYMG